VNSPLPDDVYDPPSDDLSFAVQEIDAEIRRKARSLLQGVELEVGAAFDDPMDAEANPYKKRGAESMAVEDLHDSEL
jgi:hypothetical protein